MSNTPEVEARDEYLDFSDILRSKYQDLRDAPETFTDMLELLTPMPELRSRRNLFFTFQLSCLCPTSQVPDLPAIKVQGVDSSDPRCRLSDVILPAQSYFSNVAGAVPVCTTEACLDKYREIESSFASGNVAGDPWVQVDSFGIANFQKTLISTLGYPASASLVSSTARRQLERSPEKNKKGVKFGASSFSDATVPAENLLQGRSKD